MSRIAEMEEAERRGRFDVKRMRPKRTGLAA